MKRLDLLHNDDDVNLGVLEKFIDTGSLEMPEHLSAYVEQLELIRGFFYAGNSPQRIINKLRAHCKGMTLSTARNRFNDALQYFYLDKEEKAEAWANFIFEKHLQTAEATLRSATKPEHYDLASKIYERAYKSKKLHLPTKDEVPLGLLEKKRAIYSLKAEHVGLNSADRNDLARLIDQLNAEEGQKLKLKQDLGTEPREIFDYNDYGEKND